MSEVQYSLYGGVQRDSVWSRLGKLIACLTTLGVVFGVAAAVGQVVHVPAKSKVTHASAVAAAQPVKALDQIPANTTPRPEPVDPSAATTAAVQQAIASNSAQAWSVSAYDITNSRWLVRLNDTQQMNSASLYKLYAAFALGQKVPFAQWSTKQTAGHTVQDCVDLMLRVSDNDCGNAILDLVGYGMTDRIVHSYGFALTSLNRSDNPVTTAHDTTQFMSDLYRGQLFEPTAGNFVLSSLANQKYRSAIPAGCLGCTVYNKTGLIGNVAHDTAIVKSGAGTYAVTIMSIGGSYQKIANIEQALQAALVQAVTPAN